MNDYLAVVPMIAQRVRIDRRGQMPSQRQAWCRCYCGAVLGADGFLTAGLAVVAGLAEAGLGAAPALEIVM